MYADIISALRLSY